MLLAAQLFSKVSHFFCFRVRLEVGEKIHLEKLGDERMSLRLYQRVVIDPRKNW